MSLLLWIEILMPKLSEQGGPNFAIVEAHSASLILKLEKNGTNAGFGGFVTY
jgi:hypothetical protein